MNHPILKNGLTIKFHISMQTVLNLHALFVTGEEDLESTLKIITALYLVITLEITHNYQFSSKFSLNELFVSGM